VPGNLSGVTKIVVLTGTLLESVEGIVVNMNHPTIMRKEDKRDRCNRGSKNNLGPLDEPKRHR